jgi:hypothetical protein
MEMTPLQQFSARVAPVGNSPADCPTHPGRTVGVGAAQESQKYLAGDFNLKSQKSRDDRGLDPLMPAMARARTTNPAK